MQAQSEAWTALNMVTHLHWLLRTLRSPWEQTKLACQRAHEQVNRACWPITQGYTPDRKAMLDHPAPTEPPLTIATGMSPGEIRGRHTTLRSTQVLLLNPPCLIKPLDAEVFCYANWEHTLGLPTATAAKSLQSCPCNPIDSSPPGSPIPGVLQARTLEWVAIAFSHFLGLSGLP